MSATKKLLDKYADVCLAEKDKEIAERLRIKHSTLANWKAGRAHPDADSIEKMAKTIGEPVGPWLAQIEAERARTPANRQVWLRLAATLGTTLAVALTALPSHATANGNEAVDHCLLCQIIRALIGRWHGERRRPTPEASHPFARHIATPAAA